MSHSTTEQVEAQESITLSGVKKDYWSARSYTEYGKWSQLAFERSLHERT